MRNALPGKELEEMMKRPIPKKKVGVVRLQMITERRLFYSVRHLTEPGAAVELVKPLLDKADREMLVVLSLNTKLEPLALEIAAVGGINACMVDVRDVFKHALLNNAAYVMCVHNHPSGSPEPSHSDTLMTKRMADGGTLLGIPLLDHIIIGEAGYFSFRGNGQLMRSETDGPEYAA